MRLLLAGDAKSSAILPAKAPATTGGFYFLMHAKSAQNSIRYLAPSPISTADIEALSLPK
jgi:hypothetical protein